MLQSLPALATGPCWSVTSKILATWCHALLRMSETSQLPNQAGSWDHPDYVSISHNQVLIFAIGIASYIACWGDDENSSRMGVSRQYICRPRWTEITLIGGGWRRYARKEQKEMECCCWLIVDTKNTMTGGCKGCVSINIDEGVR